MFKPGITWVYSTLETASGWGHHLYLSACSRRTLQRDDREIVVIFGFLVNDAGVKIGW